MKTANKEEKNVAKSNKGNKTSWKQEETFCGMRKSTRSGLKVTILWVTYVLLGSFAFIYLEQSISISSTEKDHHHWARFKELASSGDAFDELTELKDILQGICNHKRINQTYDWVQSRIRQHHGRSRNVNKNIKDTIEVAEDWWQSIETECTETLRIIEHVTTTHYWNISDAIYFTMTVVTTIGYGHISPRTRYGKLFCVLYSLLGVPLTCILMAKSSDMLSNKMLKLYTQAKKRHQRHHKLMLYCGTWICLSVGFIVFMFIPSLAFVKLENWTYDDALYYTFITLSTIGFGDLVAGYNSPDWFSDAYKIAIVVWTMVALSYWFLLLNFLQKALKSNVPRKIRRTLHFKTKKMAKQAEFFRHLVGSVRNSQRRTSCVESQREVMALMVEVAGALTGEEANRTSKPRSRKPSVRLDCSQGMEDECEETLLTLADLLDVNVVVKAEGVPTIKSFAAQSPMPIEEYSKSLSGILKKPRSFNGTDEESSYDPEEVILPLRDVLQLVTLVASVEEGVTAEGTDSTVSLQDDISTRTDTTSTFDTRESVPLLREIFNNKCHGNKLFKTKVHRSDQLFSKGHENEIEEVVNDDYSDDEETDTDDEIASQIDLSACKEETGNDIEAGEFYHRDDFGCVYKR